MFTMLDQLQHTLADLVEHLDVDALAGDDAAVAAERFAHLERLAAAGKLLCARRVADTGTWQDSGERTAGHWLARRTGIGVGAASDQLTAVAKTAELPATELALRTGALSGAQLTEIAPVAVANPHAESALLDAAATGSLPELRERARAARLAGEGDAERYRRLHASRSARWWTDHDGAWCLQARLAPDKGARVAAALGAFRDHLFRQARRTGVRDPFDAYTADALVAMADTTTIEIPEPADAHEHESSEPGAPEPEGAPPSAAGPLRRRTRGEPERGRAPQPSPPGRNKLVQHKIIALVDHAALVRGHALDGETCEIAGVGPVPVAAVAQVLTEGDPFLCAAVTRGVDIVNVAHLGRHTTAHQRTALEARGVRCTVKGCPNRAFLEIDHRADWAHTHTTRVDELDWLCQHHHDLKTHEHWKLETGTGPRGFHPPGHPKHPDTREDKVA